MLRFQVIGCSSGLAHRKLACSAYLLKHNKRQILFDCGEGATSAMLRLGIDPTQIGTVFITHMHPDHCMGLPLFLQANYVSRRKERLDLFVPSEAVAGIKNLFDLTYLYPLKLPFEIEIHGVDSSTRFEMTDLAIVPHQTAHLQRHAAYLRSARKKNRMMCFAYVIECEGWKIVYSGDLGSEKELDGIIDECDLLVVERSHIDLSGLADLAKEAGVRRILLTHLDEGFDLAVARRALNGSGVKQLLQAKEGLEIRL